MSKLCTSGRQSLQQPASSAIALLLLVGSLLAVAVLLSKLAAVQDAPMLWYLTISMGGSGMVLLAAALLRGDARHVPASIVAYSLVAGALMALGSALGYLSVGRVGASYVAIAMAFPTLLTYLLSLAVGMDRLDLLRMIGVACGLAGGLWLALAKGGAAASGDIPAVLAACAMPFVLAVGNVFRTRYWPNGTTPLLLSGAMLVCGALLTAPFALWHEGIRIVALSTVPILSLISVVAIASFSFQYAAFFRLQQLAGPVYLSQIGSVAAIVGSFIAVITMGETLPNGFTPAAILIACGVVVFQHATRRGVPHQVLG